MRQIESREFAFRGDKTNARTTRLNSKLTSATALRTVLPKCGDQTCSPLQYCEKTAAGLFHCEGCDKLELRYDQVKKLVEQQKIQDQLEIAAQRGRTSVQQKVLKLFEEKCKNYRYRLSASGLTNSPLSDAQVAGNTIPSVAMIVGTPAPVLEQTVHSRFGIAAESFNPVFRPTDQAVWSKTDREVLLIVACASVFLQALLLFILILIFCRLLNRRKQSGKPTVAKQPSKFSCNRENRSNGNWWKRQRSCSLNRSEEKLFPESFITSPSSQTQTLVFPVSELFGSADADYLAEVRVSDVQRRCSSCTRSVTATPFVDEQKQLEECVAGTSESCSRNQCERHSRSSPISNTDEIRIP